MIKKWKELNKQQKTLKIDDDLRKGRNIYEIKVKY